MPTLEAAQSRRVQVPGGERIDISRTVAEHGQADSTANIQVGPLPTTEYAYGVQGLTDVKHRPTDTLDFRQRLGKRAAALVVGFGGLGTIAACTTPEAGNPAAVTATPSAESSAVSSAPSAQASETAQTTSPKTTTQSEQANKLPEGPYISTPTCDDNPPDGSLSGGTFEESNPVKVLVKTGGNGSSIAVTDKNRRDAQMKVTSSTGETAIVGGFDQGFEVVIRNGATAVMEGPAALTECFVGDGERIAEEENRLADDLGIHNITKGTIVEVFPDGSIHKRQFA